MPKFPAYLVTGAIPKTAIADLNSAEFGAEVNRIGRDTLILESRVRAGLKSAGISVERVNVQTSPDAIGVVTISLKNGDNDINLRKFQEFLKARGSLSTTNHLNQDGKSRFFLSFRNDAEDSNGPDENENDAK